MAGLADLPVLSGGQDARDLDWKNLMVELEDPEQIHSSVEQTLMEVDENTGIIVGLIHNEPTNIVRGYRETSLGLEKYPETRRRDGGDSYVHDSTFCLMAAFPLSWLNNHVDERISRFSAQKLMGWWKSQIADYINRETDIFQEDIYVEDSETGGYDKKQLVGVSGRFAKEGILLRACWPEEEMSRSEWKLLKYEREMRKERFDVENYGLTPQEYADARAYSSDLRGNILYGSYDKMTAAEFCSDEARALAGEYLGEDLGTEMPTYCLSPASG